MIAYKFLRTGGEGPFTGFAWPLPSRDGTPGEWVSGDGSLGPCASGVHACRAGDLPIWLSEELWVAELAGPVIQARSKVVAPHGRLVQRVAGWNTATADQLSDGCARRARQHAVAVVRAAGFAADAVDHIPAAAGPRVSAAVGYASDAAATAAAGGAAASVAYMAVRAAINATGSPAGGVRERRWQARWLRDRLSLD
jgi:hypothetical protein